MSAPLISTLKTPICGLLGCAVPVVLAGMGGPKGAFIPPVETSRNRSMFDLSKFLKAPVFR
jgi:hypothetical protein